MIDKENLLCWLYAKRAQEKSYHDYDSERLEAFDEVIKHLEEQTDE